VLHDLFLKGPVFSFLTQAPHGSKKPPTVGSETAKKKKFVFPQTRSFFAAKVTPAAHPAPCCHALCFRWRLNALPRTAVFLRVSEAWSMGE